MSTDSPPVGFRTLAEAIDEIARRERDNGTARPPPYDPNAPSWKGRLWNQKSGLPPVLNAHAVAIIDEAARELPPDARQDFERRVAAALKECRNASGPYVQAVIRRVLAQMLPPPAA
jgi:hypothetical protein